MSGSTHRIVLLAPKIRYPVWFRQVHNFNGKYRSDRIGCNRSYSKLSDFLFGWMSDRESQVDASNSKNLLFRTRGSVKIGETFRYTVAYTPSRDQFRTEQDPPCLWIKIKNLEALPLRAAYFAGPYVLYTDITSEDYDENKAAFSSADQPIFEPQLKAGQAIHAQLYMNKVKKQHRWTINVASQVLFSTTTEVYFEIIIGRREEDIHHNSSFKAVYANPSSGLEVSHLDSLDLWNSPAPRVDAPLHLVVLTHGLHSNVSADMLHIKDKIDEIARSTKENIIVRGYMENVCKTEKGVKYLGRRVGDYVMNVLCKEKPGHVMPTKISFIAHSLGGLVQTYALAHIRSTDPKFFERIKPVHFICMASPFLGISNENPAYVKFALDFGFVGKTGQDLGLTWKPGLKHRMPLLKVLPTGPCHDVLKSFKTRTLYANMVNDGIVPLRTSSILYLDWRAISRAEKARKTSRMQSQNSDSASADSSTNSGSINQKSQDIKKDSDFEVDDDNNGNVGEVPAHNEKSSSDSFGWNTIMSYISPQSAAKKPSKIYRHSQTDSPIDNESFSEVLPKKSSVFESGVSVILPPSPSAKFICDPLSRPKTITHDRVYSERDLPPKRFGKTNSFKRVLTRSSSDLNKEHKTDSSSTDHNVMEKGKLEEKIAREWHKEMSWRKVLVALEPDAHNNIVVRRRFANAYGWPVVEHLVKEHFSKGKSDLLSDFCDIKGIDIIRGQSSVKKPPVGFSSGHQNLNNGDLSSMMRELDPIAIDESINELTISSDEHESKQHEAPTSPSNATADSRTSSNGWESHLKYDDDSENEGVVHHVGNIIDNIRGLVDINSSLLNEAQAKAEDTEPTEKSSANPLDPSYIKDMYS